MSLFQGFLQRRGEGLRLKLDPADAALLRQLAEAEQRSSEELAGDLLRGALHNRQSAAAQMRHWKRLSPREQQVAALICLNLTSRQVAARLHISPETVKTHTGNLLGKFSLRTRAELREALNGWDFSAWS